MFIFLVAVVSFVLGVAAHNELVKAEEAVKASLAAKEAQAVADIKEVEAKL